jgi:hypothetical protein
MSFSVIDKDKEMLLFPILAALFSTLFSALVLLPGTILPLFNGGQHDPIVDLVGLAASYFVVAFVATFFNVCAVYTTKVRLEGGDATFFQSIGFAFSRVHLIFGWSLVSATVGLFLHALERAGRRAGLVGKILIAILRAILATAWDVSTVFVVPVMVYEGLGPFDSIKRSIDTLKRAWGEGAMVFFAMGLVTFVVVFPAILALFGLLFAAGAMGLPVALVVALAGMLVLYILIASLVMGVARTVYVTALYAYANSRVVPPGFTEEAMVGAFGRGAYAG